MRAAFCAIVISDNGGLPRIARTSSSVSRLTMMRIPEWDVWNGSRQDSVRPVLLPTVLMETAGSGWLVASLDLGLTLALRRKGGMQTGGIFPPLPRGLEYYERHTLQVPRSGRRAAMAACSCTCALRL